MIIIVGNNYLITTNRR